MAEQSENPIESVMGKISEKIHQDSSSSDSESDSEKKSYPSESVKDKIWRLFGREKPVHRVLGGGKRRSPPRIPQVHLPEEPILQVASALCVEINGAFMVLRSIAAGKDLKKFLIVIAGLWVMSIVGSWCHFLTLFYICFVLLHTVPVFYEKFEDKIDPLAEKAMIEIKRQYAVFDAKVLSKIPVAALKAKKV
ncbi:hypothetical protein D5086_025967 [Populus alba]|uniref:Uncharacterized protein n=1 Tax=Populus alba TaxID=43335 RepID=A0ACC4B0M0_POPAL